MQTPGAASAGVPLDGFSVVALSSATWDAFAGLAERNNGVFGGCWCMWFQTFYAEKRRAEDDNRTQKHRLVDEGRAHAALVMEDGEAVAWCEYGTPGELPNIYHRKQYEAELDVLPDYRLTCIFVDRHHRHRGLSAVALRGALGLIAEAGGGVVEGYPHDNDGARQAVLYNGTRRLFESAGFEYIRPKGSKNCVMRTVVPAASRP